MQNRWNERDYAAFKPQNSPDFDALVYASRLLGAEVDLVLHGGGNTSVKTVITDTIGDRRDVLVVKASGSSMENIGPEGFVTLDRSGLLKMSRLNALDDTALADQFTLCRAVPGTKVPSIETLLHALLPPKFICHTHATAILSLTNRTDSASVLESVFGKTVVVLPYVKAGFDLAKQVSAAFASAKTARAIVLTHHGIITWGESAKEAYDSMLSFVNIAEAFIAQKQRADRTGSPATSATLARERYARIAPIVRGLLSPQTGNEDNPIGRTVLVPVFDDDIRAAIDSPGAKMLLVSPPLTPDYLIRTKALPLWIDTPSFDDPEAFRKQLAMAIEAFRQEDTAYIDRNRARLTGEVPNGNALPRVVLLPGLGVVCAAEDATAASVAADITAQAIRTKTAIRLSGGTYAGLSEDHLFDMEYRSYQIAKLCTRNAKSLKGCVALVTGSAGAIGTGVCSRLLEEGCHVALTDLAGEPLDRSVAAFKSIHGNRVLGVALDVTDPASVAAGFARVCAEWGGADLVIVNAGIAHVQPLVEMDLERFRLLERVNIDGTLLIIREAGRLFKVQATGGDIVLISTKNVFAPGAKFGAYSATKAAAHQLARIASLELAELGVRVNMVAPDAVFSHGEKRSGLWAEVGPDRMRARGLDEKGLEQYYQSRNLLKARVTAEHVANAVLFFATHQTPTTGATIPVDGGLPDATPR